MCGGGGGWVEARRRGVVVETQRSNAKTGLPLSHTLPSLSHRLYAVVASEHQKSTWWKRTTCGGRGKKEGASMFAARASSRPVVREFVCPPRLWQRASPRASRLTPHCHLFHTHAHGAAKGRRGRGGRARAKKKTPPHLEPVAPRVVPHKGGRAHQGVQRVAGSACAHVESVCVSCVRWRERRERKSVAGFFFVDDHTPLFLFFNRKTRLGRGQGQTHAHHAHTHELHKLLLRERETPPASLLAMAASSPPRPHDWAYTPLCPDQVRENRGWCACVCCVFIVQAVVF